MRPTRQPAGIQLCMFTLLQFLGMPEAHTWMIPALRKGLLTQVVFWGEKLGGTADADSVGEFKRLLEQALPDMLVYPSIILEMKRCFDALRERAARPAFTESVLYPMWLPLRTLTNERATLVKDWQERRSALVCYNVQCGKIANGDTSRGCGGCHTAVYCSQACQRSDWVDGHRDECKPLLVVYRRLAVNGIHHREKSVIRTLLDRDCRRFRVYICMELVKFLARDPDPPYLIAFQYDDIMGAKLAFSPVQAALEKPLVKPMLLRMHREMVQGRVAMPLHVLVVRHGNQHWSAPFPVHGSSLQLFSALVDMAKDVAAGRVRQEEVEARVKGWILAVGASAEFH